MSVKEQLEKHLENNGLKSELENLNLKSNICVFNFLTLLKEFLLSFDSLTIEQWMFELYEYTVKKSFPHKDTLYMKESSIPIYEEVLLLLSSLNGSAYIDYNIKETIDEYKIFKEAYKNLFVYEMMQLDMEITGHNTIDHVLMVKDVTMHISKQLYDLGLPIDLGIVLGSSLGHDIGKYGVTKEEQSRVPYLHYYYTESWFKSLELEKIGHIATNHSTWDLELETLPLESLVLIYADFRVKNRWKDDHLEMHIFDLTDSFEIILEKLDNVDTAKENRYKKVYSKLKDFEDYMVSLGVDTTLAGELTKKDKIFWSLLKGEDIVDSFKYKSIENNIYLMSNFMNEERFHQILEEARGEGDWRRLRLYIEILKEYSLYLTQKQKIMVYHFLVDHLLHKEEGIRKESAYLIGKLIANYDEEYRKELPKTVDRNRPLQTSLDIFDQLLNDLLYPSHKLLDSQDEWLYNLKIIVKSLFENCNQIQNTDYFDKLNQFYQNSDNLISKPQFYLLQTISYLPLNGLDSPRKKRLYSYILKNVSIEHTNIRLSTFDRIFEVLGIIDDPDLSIPLADFLSKNLSKSTIPAENYLKYIIGNKLKLVDSDLQTLRENYRSDEASVPELFLANLKTATAWTIKKINIDILYDQVRKNPPTTGIHTAIHLCNLLKVSAIERVRNYSGYTLLNIIPLLSFEQRNDVSIELLRALEMDSYQFTKFIPEYLGQILLYLPPKELDEVIDDLENKIKVSRPQTILLILNTIGVSVLNYPKYESLFKEEENLNSKRLKRLLGLLLVPLASYKLELKTESLRVIASTIFNSNELCLQDKMFVFKRLAKKILTLIEDSKNNNFSFYNNAASLNHIYRFVSEYEYNYGSLDMQILEDVAFFPGSFDPFSLGHREIAKEIRKHGFEVYLAVDEFSWSKRTEAHQLRRNIINMTIAKEDGIYLFPKEIPININSDQDMLGLRNIFGTREVYIAVGSDVVLNASAYKMKKEVLNFSHVIFDRRTDETILPLDELTNKAINNINNNVIRLTLPTQFEDISSTQIRDNIDKNRDISKLIDPMAAEYIYNYGLYLREPLYKTLLETKTLDVEVHRNLSSELLDYLYDSFGSMLDIDGLLEIREKLSYRIIILKDTSKNIAIGFSAFYWVRHSMLFDEFNDQNITQFIRNNAKGRTAFISCLYAKDDDDHTMDMVLNETLSIALNRDYNYALYANTMIKGSNNKALEFLIMQGFIETPFLLKESPMLMVDMNNPISINLDLENNLKAPYDAHPKILEAITSSRKKIKKALADLYPGELLISFNRTMVYSKLIQMVCDENEVSTTDNNKKSLGEKMCVPFGIILNNSIIPNTVTKTLHTEKIFSKDIKCFTITEFPNYLSLEGQCKTIKSFNRKVILLDDLLHKGYRIKIVEPQLRQQGIEISKLFVGILSGRGKEIAKIRNLDIDSAYFVPNLRLWFNESSQYPFLGGDMVKRDYADTNLIPSVNLVLPYVSPKFIKDVSEELIFELSSVSLTNALELFKVIETVYQEINEKNLNLASLGEVVFIPRYPDMDRSVFENKHLKPSSFIETDIDYLKRLEHTLKGHRSD
ncbi:MAG: cytidyltransferase [Gudongella sp.]|nr:cytidyltransferase [Gudongella sp.]